PRRRVVRPPTEVHTAAKLVPCDPSYVARLDDPCSTLPSKKPTSDAAASAHSLAIRPPQAIIRYRPEERFGLGHRLNLREGKDLHEHPDHTPDARSRDGGAAVGRAVRLRTKTRQAFVPFTVPL